MNDLLASLKRHRLLIALNLLVTLLFLLYGAREFDWPFLRQLENTAYDTRLLLTMPDSVDPRIVIVDIDEKSLTEEGRWPWSRDRVALLVSELFDTYQVKVLGFDIVFAEPDRSSGLNVLEELGKTAFRDISQYAERLHDLRVKLDYDQLFADSLKGRPVVLGYYFNETRTRGDVSKIGKLPPPTFVEGSFAGKKIDFLTAFGYGANLPRVQAAAAAAGHFNPAVDEDGVVRRVPMLYQYESQLYQSLALAMAKEVLGIKRVIPEYVDPPWGSKSYSGLEWLRLGERLIPVDQHLQTLVPYRGRQASFPYLSATDVLHGRADATVLAGAIAIVGTTAPGLMDLRVTPVQRAYPGVEVHANLLSGILDQSIKEAPAYTIGAEFVALLLIGLIMGLSLPLVSPLAATVITVAVLTLVIGINMAAWQNGNLVLPVASSVVLTVVLFLLDMSYGFFVERRGKRQLSGLFGQYIPPELVDEMSSDPGAYSLEAESRNMSVLFSDVRGFTTISEGLDPPELSRLMNELLTPLTQIIHKHRGTIDKYMGDAIMAFWGAPLADADHARHAVAAGMEMIDRLKTLRKEFAARGWPEVNIGVGINTGIMSVGNMGSEFRMAYTVMGDAVNLGSRLEGLTKEYGVSIIVSESTLREVPNFAFRELDRVRVKGKNEPVAIYEPIGAAVEVEKAVRDELKLYEQALKYYRKQDWDRAELQFLNLRKLARNRKLYQMYTERVAHYRATPPAADWDGTFTHTSK